MNEVHPTTVGVKVLSGGSSQNNRKVKGKPMHIGRDVFVAHYEKSPEKQRISAEESMRLAIEQFRGSNPFSTMTTTTTETPTVTQNGTDKKYDFNMDVLLERTVKAMKRWGGQPVKSYVITQFVDKKLNANRTRQLIDRGVELGILESWTTPVGPNRPNQTALWVGLPNQNRTPVKPDGGYPGVINPDAGSEPVNPQPTESVTETVSQNAGLHPIKVKPAVLSKEELSTRAFKAIERQYNEMNQETKEEIALLAMDNKSVQELQKQFHVLGGVIGRIKREHGLAVGLKPIKKHKPKIKPAANEIDNAADLVLAKALPKTMPVPAKAIAVAPQATTTYEVSVLKLVPSEVTLTVRASSFGEAERLAAVTENVVEILSVTKAR